MVFGARKTEVVEPSVRVDMPDSDPELRDEVDPDPFVEEMVARLRDGLGTLVAIDEWGRPLAWRNVVRLALGPMASRLRDTEQALELAVSMMPGAAETAPDAPAEAAPEALSVVEPPTTTEYVAQPPAEAAAEPVAEAPERFVAPENPTPMEYLAAPSALAAEATVEVILPASEAAPEAPVHEASFEEVHGHAVLVEEPIVVEEPVEEPAAPTVAGQPAPIHTAPQGQQPAVPVAPTAATSLFTVSGDQRSVPVSPLGSGELLGGRGTDDPTTAKYDRFLTGLYGQGQQVRGDEDRGPR